MTRPYLAFAWPPRCSDAEAQAHGLQRQLQARPAWRLAWAGEGLQVWTSPDRPLPVSAAPDGAGVVLGRLLRRRTPRPDRRDRRPAAGTIVEAAAASLVDDHWGEYLALLPEPRRLRVWGLRDPSGALDVLTWRRGGLSFVGSDLVDLPLEATPPDTALDWNVIACVLAEPAVVADRTALNVETIPAGWLQPMGGRREEGVAFWRPGAFVETCQEPASALPELVRSSVEHAVDGLLQGVSAISIEVSGGLDSAIVAAALVSTGHRSSVAEAVNHHAPAVLADERSWATEVCRHLSLPLRTVRRATPPLALPDYAELARYARPAINALDTPRDRAGARHAVEVGAEAIVGGKGGDAVFFQRPTADVLADRRRHEGRLVLLGPFARDLARWLRRSVWSVAWEAARDDRRDPTVTALGGHPWLADLHEIGPAKRFQIAALAAVQAHRGVNRRTLAVDAIHPLLSQPVLELGLSIPAWRLVEGRTGLIGRGLARRAFEEALPERVVWRRSKGDLTAHYSRWVAASREVLLPLLCDGVLSDAGYLDRDAVRSALEPERLIYRSDVRTLLSAAAIELWVRHWQGRAPDLAPRRG